MDPETKEPYKVDLEYLDFKKLSYRVTLIDIAIHTAGGIAGIGYAILTEQTAHDLIDQFFALPLDVQNWIWIYFILFEFGMLSVLYIATYIHLVLTHGQSVDEYEDY